MINRILHILLIDDDEDDFIITRSLLRDIAGENLNLHWARNLDTARELTRKLSFDLFLIDYKLGKDSGLQFLHYLHDFSPDKPAIMLTGKGDSRIDQEAIKLGAYDYLEKERLSSGQLERSMRYALKHADTLRALKESERKYRTIIEHSKEIIFLVNEELKIVHISRAVEQYLGYSREEIYGMDSTLLFEDSSQMLEIVALIQENNQLQDYTLRVKTREGESKTGLLSCVAEKDEKGHYYFHGIFSDQTQRIRAEKAMLHSQKMQSTARLMQVLAHEVRNPLMNINLSLGSFSDQVREEESALLEIIQRNARRVDELITEVLNAASEKEIQKRKIRIGEVINLALEQVSDRALMQKVEIIADIQESPGITANPEQLATALVNILVNAIEAMEGIDKPRILVTTEVKGHGTLLRIRDNGIGMDKELQSKLFEPFYTAKTNGVGLGLASTLSILKAHDAEIEVKSEVGEGSEFIISF